MSKSRSRHPSRQISAASKNGSAGIASKTTARVAVEDASENIEQEESTTTLATEETSQETEKEASPAAPARADTKPAASAKQASPAKTAKAVPNTPVPGKAAKTVKAVPNTPAPRAIPHTPAVAGSKAQSRDAAKYERRQAERQTRYLAARRRRRNRIVAILCTVLAIAIVGGGTFYLVHQYTSGAFQSKPASQGSYQEPIFNNSYPPVDNVYCDQLEGSVEHIHAYVSMYINGQASPIPQYVGIPQDSSGNSACYYWLHTHDSSGIIHIESPVNEVFTLGQFLDEWDQQFQSLGFPTELLLKTGWTIWINGKIYNGSLASVPLNAHNIITLAYNSPNVKPVTTYNWGSL